MPDFAGGGEEAPFRLESELYKYFNPCIFRSLQFAAADIPDDAGAGEGCGAAAVRAAGLGRRGDGGARQQRRRRRRQPGHAVRHRARRRGEPTHEFFETLAFATARHRRSCGGALRSVPACARCSVHMLARLVGTTGVPQVATQQLACISGCPKCHAALTHAMLPNHASRVQRPQHVTRHIAEHPARCKVLKQVSRS